MAVSPPTRRAIIIGALTAVTLTAALTQGLLSGTRISGGQRDNATSAEAARTETSQNAAAGTGDINAIPVPEEANGGLEQAGSSARTSDRDGGSRTADHRQNSPADPPSDQTDRADAAPADRETPDSQDTVDPYAEPDSPADEPAYITIGSCAPTECWQLLLIHHGWQITADGVNGPGTRRAVREFQHANNLPTTGTLDQTTRDLLQSAAAAGHSRYLTAPLPVEPTGQALIAVYEGIADTVGFDWRSHGVTFHLGCSDAQILHIGVCTRGSYEPDTRKIHLDPDELADPAARQHVILHELAHAWQMTVRGWPAAGEDLAAWGKHELEGLEAAADCLAAAWGSASRGNYYHCPPDAIAHMHSLYLDTVP